MFSLEKHLDKTFIGRTWRTFEFLGRLFSATGIINVAKKTRQHCLEKLLQLYEQHRDRRLSQALAGMGWLHGYTDTSCSLPRRAFKRK